MVNPTFSKPIGDVIVLFLWHDCIFPEYDFHFDWCWHFLILIWFHWVNFWNCIIHIYIYICILCVLCVYIVYMCMYIYIKKTLYTYEFSKWGYLESYMERNFFRGSALATWLGFTATFVARPLGGMFLGILSDSFGRKVAVVITVIGMLAATVGQGLLPTPRGWGEESFAGQLGLYMLFILRLAQGLCTEP